MISVEKVPAVNRVGLSQISNLLIRLRAFFIPDDQEKIPLSHSFLLSIKALTTKELQPLKHLRAIFYKNHPGHGDQGWTNLSKLGP